MKEWLQWIERWNSLFDEQASVDLHPQLELPLALSARFSYAILHCKGTNFLAALDEEGDTPANYRHYQQKLESAAQLPVVFFISRIPAYQYERMVNYRISFITQTGYVYVTHGLAKMVPVRGRTSAPLMARDYLSPVAQVLLFRHLLFHDIHGKSLRSIADVLGRYTSMSISLAKAELEENGLCVYTGAITRGQLEFQKDDSELWTLAQPVLKSPVQKLRYVRMSHAVPHLTLAGESALSTQTLLAPPALPVYAVGKFEMRNFLAHGMVAEVSEEDANAVIEHWRYAPALLMKPGETCVDKLSLFLSLQGSADDRVRQELHRLTLP